MHYYDDLFVDKVEHFLFSGIDELVVLENLVSGKKVLLIGEVHRGKKNEKDYASKPKIENLKNFVEYATKELGMPVFYEGHGEVEERKFMLPDIHDFFGKLYRDESDSGLVFSNEGFGVIISLGKIAGKWGKKLDMLINVDDRNEFTAKNFKNTILDYTDWRFSYHVSVMDIDDSFFKSTQWEIDLSSFLTVKDLFVILNHNLSLYVKFFHNICRRECWEKPFSREVLFMWKFPRVKWEDNMREFVSSSAISNIIDLWRSRNAFFEKYMGVLLNKGDLYDPVTVLVDIKKYEDEVMRPLENMLVHIINYFRTFSSFLELALNAPENKSGELFHAMYNFYSYSNIRNPELARLDSRFDSKFNNKFEAEVKKVVEQSKFLLKDSENLITTRLFPFVFRDYSFLNDNIEPPLLHNFTSEILCPHLAISGRESKMDSCSNTFLMYSEKFENQVTEFFLGDDPRDSIFVAGSKHIHSTFEKITGEKFMPGHLDAEKIWANIFKFSRDKKFISLLFNSFELIETDQEYLNVLDGEEWSLASAESPASTNKNYGLAAPRMGHLGNIKRSKSIAHINQYLPEDYNKIITPVVEKAAARIKNLKNIVGEAHKNEGQRGRRGEKIFPPHDPRRSTRVEVEKNLFSNRKRTTVEKEKHEARMRKAAEYFHNYTSKLYDDVKNDYPDKDFDDLLKNVEIFATNLEDFLYEGWTFSKDLKIFIHVKTGI